MNRELERLSAAIADATRGMNAEELTRHPAGKWGAAEVLEHLSLTYSGTRRGFEKCLQAERPLASRITLKQRLAVLLVTRLGYFPTGREAPETTRPKGDAAEDVARDIAGKIEAMDRAIAACEEKYGVRERLLDHPVLGPLTATQWRRFHWIHGRHHMRQIRGLREAG